MREFDKAWKKSSAIPIERSKIMVWPVQNGMRALIDGKYYETSMTRDQLLLIASRFLNCALENWEELPDQPQQQGYAEAENLEDD